MGAYLDRPKTAKHSARGECRVGERAVVYASTAVQGWRVSMEDAHLIVPDFDKDTALLAVFDGHGGKEVAEYCSRRMPEMLQSNSSYKSDDLPTALKTLFMHCDRKLLEKDVIREMKQYMEGAGEDDEAESDSSEGKKEVSKLVEEADMPLDTLLAQYMAERVREGEGESGDEEMNEEDGRRTPPDAHVRSMLHALANQVGFEIEFEDSSDSEDSEYDDEDMDGEGEGEGEGEDETGRDRDREEEGKGEGKKGREGEGEAEGEGKGEGEGEGEGEGKGEKKVEKEEITKETDSQKPDSVEESTAIESENPDKDETKCVTSSDRSDTTVLRSYMDHLKDATRRHILENNFCLHNNEGESQTTGDERSLLEVGSEVESQVTTSDSSTAGSGDGGLVRNAVNSETEVEIGQQSVVGSSTITCATSSSSACATSSSSVRASSDDDESQQFSKSHLLLDLLTSTVANEAPQLISPNNEVSSSDVLNSRKRHRREEELEEEGRPKRVCRGVMEEQGYHSGTTAVVCLLREKSLTVANAGDSRCVLSCRGVAIDMSEDHKPTDEGELSRIQRAGGRVGADGRVNGGLNLSRAIGDHFYKENVSLPLEQQMISALPDVESRQLEAGDEFIVIACDGIWNTKSSQEVVDFVRSHLSERADSEQPVGPILENICESLCDACLALDTDNDGTGCDNMTVTIALLQPPHSFLPILPNNT